MLKHGIGRGRRGRITSTAAGGSTESIAVDSGVMTLAGQTVTPLLHERVTVTAGALALAGQTVDVNTSTPSAPVISSVTIDDTTPVINQTLTASVVSSGSPTYTYQWNRDGVAITGATASTHVVRDPEDLNAQLSVTVTATNGGGSDVETSALTSFVVPEGVLRTRYISTTGNDTTGDGSIGNPWLTLNKLHTEALAGDLFYIRGGTYLQPSGRSQWTKDGTSTNRINVFAYPGETPIIDGTNLTAGFYTGWVIDMSGANYWRLFGLTIEKGPDGGLVMRGTTGTGSSFNIVDNCVFRRNRANVTNNAGTGFSAYELSGDGILRNCDAYENGLTGGGSGDNADGFQITNYTPSGQWLVEGNRSWNNGDDGYDFYAVTNSSTHSGAILTNNWAMQNGKDLTGTVIAAADGNGFKLGGFDNGSVSGNILITYSVSVDNKQYGFDDNQAANLITVYNNTAAFNDVGGFQFNGSGVSAAHVVKNCLSLSDAGNPSTEAQMTNNSWQAGTGVTVTTGDFVEANVTTGLAQMKAARSADGSLPTLTFLKLVVGSDLIDKGVDVGLPFNGAAPDLGAFEYTP